MTATEMWIDDITQTIWASSEVKEWQKDLIKASAKSVEIKIITDGLNNSWAKPEFKIKPKVWGSW